MSTRDFDCIWSQEDSDNYQAELSAWILEYEWYRHLLMWEMSVLGNRNAERVRELAGRLAHYAMMAFGEGEDE